MTESKYWTFLRSGLRRLWLKYPTKQVAVTAARRDYRGDNPRQKWEYKCAACKNYFKRTEIHVDHIVPCGRLSKEAHLERYITTLFCELNNLQVLCVVCHTEKTKSDMKNLED